MIKLFVTDLDGTLLPTGQTVSAENIKAVQAAVNAGVIVTIATGRMYKAALPVAKNLGVDVPIITYNGALIKSTNGKVLYESAVAPEYAKKVIEYCRAKNYYLQLYSNDELYFAEYTAKSAEYESAQHIKGHTVGWDGLFNHLTGVSKLLSITDGFDETAARIAELEAAIGDGVKVTRSNANYAEIINKGISKAAGIKRLAEKLGISMSETMSIGDADNDLPMLKATAKSIAMGNAQDNIKAVCDYVTTSCEENGFAAAIYKYVLEK